MGIVGTGQPPSLLGLTAAYGPLGHAEGQRDALAPLYDAVPPASSSAESMALSIVEQPSVHASPTSITAMLGEEVPEEDHCPPIAPRDGAGVGAASEHGMGRGVGGAVGRAVKGLGFRV